MNLSCQHCGETRQLDIIAEHYDIRTTILKSITIFCNVCSKETTVYNVQEA